MSSNIRIGANITKLSLPLAFGKEIKYANIKLAKNNLPTYEVC